MKISTSVQNDFEFFRTTHLKMVGYEVGHSVVSDPSGSSALECWHSKDTHGKAIPCRDAASLSEALVGKASWNLQVKLWAEDLADGMLLTQEELVDYCHGLPEWIFKATVKQAQKILMETIGFIPSFARLTIVNGQWWPPYMRSWSPEI